MASRQGICAQVEFLEECIPLCSGLTILLGFERNDLSLLRHMSFVDVYGTDSLGT